MIFEISIIFKKKSFQDEFVYSYIRIYNKTTHKTKLISTGLKFLKKNVNWGGTTIKEKNRNKISRLKGNYINHNMVEHKKMNELLELKLDKVRNDIDLSHSPHLDSSDFIAYVKTYARRLKNIKKFGTYNSYMTFISDLENYSKSRNKTTIKFNNINKILINDFQDFLVEKNLKASTIQTRMYKFKKMVEKSIDEDIFITNKNPFFRYKNPVRPVKKPILTEKELHLIINSPPLKNSIRANYIYIDKDGYENHHPIEISRLMFLFQFFSNGMRVSDLLFLRWKNFKFNEDECEIKYEMYKTKIECRIALNDHHVSILKHFIDKEVYFSSYEEQEVKCPRCKSQRLLKNGSFQHKIKRKTLKCTECSRVFVEKRPLPITSFFNESLKEINNIVHFNHIQKAPHPDPDVSRYNNGHIYYAENIYFKDLLIQKAFDEKQLKNLNVEKENKIYSRWEELFNQDDDYVIFFGKLPEDEKTNIDMHYTNLKESIELNLHHLDTLISKFKELEFKHYLNIFKLYSKDRQNDFIFPMLKSSDFESFNDLHSIPENLYIQYMTKSRRHAGLLKEIMKKLKIKTNLTSHSARHSFTAFLVNKNIDIYTISRSLGHSSISITEKYLPKFDFDKINKDLKSFSSAFSTDIL